MCCRDLQDRSLSISLYLSSLSNTCVRVYDRSLCLSLSVCQRLARQTDVVQMCSGDLQDRSLSLSIYLAHVFPVYIKDLFCTFAPVRCVGHCLLWLMCKVSVLHSWCYGVRHLSYMYVLHICFECLFYTSVLHISFTHLFYCVQQRSYTADTTVWDICFTCLSDTSVLHDCFTPLSYTSVLNICFTHLFYTSVLNSSTSTHSGISSVYTKDLSYTVALFRKNIHGTKCVTLFH